jgi:hypothetical protein
MGEISGVLDLSAADVIEIAGAGRGAHMALLARRFGGVLFESGRESQCADAVRVFWYTGTAQPGEDTASMLEEAAGRCDALIVPHAVAALDTVRAAADGLARIAARRDVGSGLALSVFGRGLARDLFRFTSPRHAAA